MYPYVTKPGNYLLRRNGQTHAWARFKMRRLYGQRSTVGSWSHAQMYATPRSIAYRVAAEKPDKCVDGCKSGSHDHGLQQIADALDVRIWTDDEPLTRCILGRCLVDVVSTNHLLRCADIEPELLKRTKEIDSRPGGAAEKRNTTQDGLRASQDAI